MSRLIDRGAQDASLDGEMTGDALEWVLDSVGLIMLVQLAAGGDADRELAPLGLNRTHHRILYLVAHKPGVTVGEIVTLLRLSAQAVQSPLRVLIDDDLITQQPSEQDRRKRHLHLTAKGERLLSQLSRSQFTRLAAARRKVGDDSFQGFLRFMRAMTTDEDREWLYGPTMTSTSGKD